MGVKHRVSFGWKRHPKAMLVRFVRKEDEHILRGAGFGFDYRLGCWRMQFAGRDASPRPTEEEGRRLVALLEKMGAVVLWVL